MTSLETTQGLIYELAELEGFREKPYIDVLVEKHPERYGITLDEMAIIKKHFNKLKVTFGHGFTFIEEDESLNVLVAKARKYKERLSQKIPFFNDLPVLIQNVLTVIAYQLGIKGLLKFKKTLKYLENRDWHNASIEMLDSHWAKVDTPERAKKLSEYVRSLV